MVHAWIRGYQVGGKSLMWARWTQRWSDLDFEANARDGIGVDWPIRYADYLTSEVGATRALAHVAVPGRYDGDVAIEPGTKARAE